MRKLLIIAVMVAFCGCNPANGNKTVGGKQNKTLAKAGANKLFAPDTVFTFDNYDEGGLPAGWSQYKTGTGKPGIWKIVDDNGNKVLMQTSENYHGYHFNVAVNDSLKYGNLELSVKFKAVKGDEDGGGGPVWRFYDEENYYIARANPLENNFRLYKVVNGKRILLKSANFNIETGKWYSLKIVMSENNIKCFFNGELKLEADDNTFVKAGKIGLWTKADAVTMFDNLEVKKQ